MGEAAATGSSWSLDHDPLAHRLVERFEERFATDTARVLERVELELAAENGGKHEDQVAVVGKVTQAAADHRPQTVRNGHPPRGRVRCVDQGAFGYEEPDDLADEERIPACLLLKPGGELPGWLDARAEADEARHLVLGQPRESQPSCHRLARQLGQRRRQGLLEARVDVPVGSDDQETARGEDAREKLQQQQRRRVGGVQVVEHEEERPLAGGVDEERGGGVEHLKARPLGTGGRRLVEIGKQLAELGKDPRDVRRAVTKPAPDHGRVVVSHVSP